ncbi:hypothetical protein N0V90_011768 [Kalmusia sp. IMI 367209]|nr:hypothetical protein N0V90_011768 [Kalmusia sp. IMI 367209]
MPKRVPDMKLKEYGAVVSRTEDGNFEIFETQKYFDMEKDFEYIAQYKLEDGKLEKVDRIVPIHEKWEWPIFYLFENVHTIGIADSKKNRKDTQRYFGGVCVMAETDKERTLFLDTEIEWNKDGDTLTKEFGAVTEKNKNLLEGTEELDVHKEVLKDLLDKLKKNDTIPAEAIPKSGRKFSDLLPIRIVKPTLESET